MDKIFETKFNRKSLLRDYFRMVILGGSGSGKTTYLLSLFRTLVGKYKHIFLFSPVINKSYDYYVWPDHVFKITSPEELEYFLCKVDQDLSTLVEKKPIKSKFLLILDDLGDMQVKAKKLSSLMNMGRHINLSIIMLCQTYRHVPSGCRPSITHLCCCNVSDADVDNLTKSMSLLSTKQLVRALSIMKVASKGRKIYIIENAVFSDKDVRVCYDTADKNVIENKPNAYILLSQFSHMKDQLPEILGDKSDQ